MVQMNRKTNVIALAIVLCLVFAFGAAAAIFAIPATETAYALDNVAQFHFYGLSNYGGSKPMVVSRSVIRVTTISPAAHLVLFSRQADRLL